MCATSQPHCSPGMEISLRSCLAFTLTDLGEKSGALPLAEVTVVPDGQTLLGQAQLLERRGEEAEAPLGWTLFSRALSFLRAQDLLISDYLTDLPGEWELKAVSQEAVRTERAELRWFGSSSKV